MPDRPVIFSTAPLRGPGARPRSEELGEVIVDPWIDQHPLRLYNERAAGRRAPPSSAPRSSSARPTAATGPVLDLPARRHRLDPGRPHQRRPRRRHRQGHPRAAGARPQRRRRGRARRRPAARRAPATSCAADRDVREGEVYRDGSIPYQRFRGWQLAGRTAGLVGLGAVGRADPLAARGPRHAGDRQRPVRRRRHRTTSTTCWPRPTSCRCTPPSRPTRSG